MKTPEQIDQVMQSIPVEWQSRWCGGERGACACLGCVQIGNRAVIVEKITGEPYRGDPEYIDEAKLKEYGALYTDNKVTREEWEAWMRTRPQEAQSPDGLVVIADKTGSGKSTVMADIITTFKKGDVSISIEDPIERPLK